MKTNQYHLYDMSGQLVYGVNHFSLSFCCGKHTEPLTCAGKS